KVLTPVDKNGTPIKCEGSVCEGGFDWSWTQHTAWRIDEKSEPGIVYLTVFDNGDARGMEQPAMPEMKYTRGVVNKVDEKKMTVEQVWEVGKDPGFEYYSPVTGLCQYQPDKGSVVVYYSTAGMGDIARSAGRKQGRIHPVITEYRWGETKPAVKIKLWDTMGYQAFPIHIEKAFSVERK
ncbi:aryl-sulfate sulfotransferase, partial [Sutterella massiliensis]